MAKNIKFISSGFQQLILTDGVSGAVSGAASKISSSAPGTTVQMDVESFAGHQRPLARVATTAQSFRESVQQREALERAVNGAHFGNTKKNSGKMKGL